MRPDKLTTKLQTALADAQSLAVGREHQFIEPAHLAHTLLNQEGGTLSHILSSAGINLNKLGSKIIKLLDSIPTVTGSAGDVHISRDLDRILNVMDKAAQERNDDYIASELFAVAAFENKGKLGELFRQSGTDKTRINQAIDALRGGEKVSDSNAEENRQALEKYTSDLTAQAEKGKLDPVIGRDEEIRRTIQVLQRRTKNNPVLIATPVLVKPLL